MASREMNKMNLIDLLKAFLVIAIMAGCIMFFIIRLADYADQQALNEVYGDPAAGYTVEYRIF